LNPLLGNPHPGKTRGGGEQNLGTQRAGSVGRDWREKGERRLGRRVAVRGARGEGAFSEPGSGWVGGNGVRNGPAGDSQGVPRGPRQFCRSVFVLFARGRAGGQTEKGGNLAPPMGPENHPFRLTALSPTKRDVSGRPKFHETKKTRHPGGTRGGGPKQSGRGSAGPALGFPDRTRRKTKPQKAPCSTSPPAVGPKPEPKRPDCAFVTSTAPTNRARNPAEKGRKNGPVAAGGPNIKGRTDFRWGCSVIPPKLTNKMFQRFLPTRGGGRGELQTSEGDGHLARGPNFRSQQGGGGASPPGRGGGEGAGDQPVPWRDENPKTGDGERTGQGRSGGGGRAAAGPPRRWTFRGERWRGAGAGRSPPT